MIPTTAQSMLTTVPAPILPSNIAIVSVSPCVINAEATELDCSFAGVNANNLPRNLPSSLKKLELQGNLLENWNSINEVLRCGFISK